MRFPTLMLGLVVGAWSAPLAAQLELLGGVRLAVGGSNLFNTYPDQQVKPANVSFGRFIYSRSVTQFGMNGGFYYARLALSL